MALTEDERRKALRILDELDKQTRTKILNSLIAFTNWLKGALYQIYEKVKNTLSDIWEKCRAAFR